MLKVTFTKSGYLGLLKIKNDNLNEGPYKEIGRRPQGA